MRRRTLLGVYAGAMGRGCLGIPHRSEVRLAWIRLVNERDDDFTVEVLVEEGDDQVFSDTFHVGSHPGSAVVERDHPSSVGVDTSFDSTQAVSLSTSSSSMPSKVTRTGSE